MKEFIIVKGSKTLTRRGMRADLFVILAGEPEFLDDVNIPVIIIGRDRAESFAKMFGGTVEEI